MSDAILVAGGAGYIGSHTVQQLLARGEPVVVLDNLSTGFRQAVPGATFIEGDVGEPPNDDDDAIETCRRQNEALSEGIATNQASMKALSTEHYETLSRNEGAERDISTLTDIVSSLRQTKVSIEKPPPKRISVSSSAPLTSAEPTLPGCRHGPPKNGGNGSSQASCSITMFE